MEKFKSSNQIISPKETAWQAVKFTLFSISAGIVQVLSFAVMNEFTDFPYWPCYITALTLSIIYNFTVNRRFTFKSVANIPKAMLKILGFYCIFAPASIYLGNIAEGNGVNEYIILGVTMFFNLCFEFLFCQFVVYKGTINSNNLAKRKENKQ